MKIKNVHLRYLICFSQKSLLLSHLDSSGMPSPSEFCGCKILDSAAVVHFLSTDSVKTFTEYADKVFIPFLLQQLQQACRVDCVWDRYLPHSIEEATREQEDMAHVQRCHNKPRFRKKWSDFLRVAKDKQELFFFQTAKVCSRREKDLYHIR